MRAPTLVRQLTQVHVLVVAFACALLVAGTMTASAWILRRDQDDDLRAMAQALCHTIAMERQASRADEVEIAGRVFREGAISGYRMELLQAGTVRAAEGDLPQWTGNEGEPAPSRACRSTRLRSGEEVNYRSCAETCNGHAVVRVVTADVLLQPQVRRVALGILSALPLAVFAGALVGAVWFRRQLRPLEDLRRAASELEARPGVALGVGARPMELQGLERAFDNLLERLGDAIGREKRFTQEASHELRTPLTILRGRIEHLVRQLEGRPELRQEAEGALADLLSLDRLVDALLILARSESVQLPTTPVNLCDLAREVASKEARANGHTENPAQVLAPDEILVRGSEELLERALGNLIENSRKFAGEKARIRVRVFQDNGHGVIAVEDDGPGILPELRPLVFERFVRGPAHRNRVPGVGLGLAVVRAIAERHEGEVSTGPGALGGEEVRLSLPLL